MPMQTVAENIGSQACDDIDDLRRQLSITQPVDHHETNMAIQENGSVNQPHVELQPHRMSSFQAKAEVERDVSRVEIELFTANDLRPNDVGNDV